MDSWRNSTSLRSYERLADEWLSNAQGTATVPQSRSSHSGRGEVFKSSPQPPKSVQGRSNDRALTAARLPIVIETLPD
jgi:hypothetical protein